MVRLEARLHPDEAALILKAVDAAIATSAEAPDSEDASAEAPSSDEDASAEASASLPSAETSPTVTPRRLLAPASAEALLADARREARPDGLVRVADAYLASSRAEGRPAPERHQLIVCVREDHLTPSELSVEVEGVGQAGAETLRRLACDASITRVTVDVEGTPLDLGRKARVVSPALRRALLARDRGCRFPGCNNQRWVDAHHIDHWIDGGATHRDNLVLLCAAHHRLVHEGGFRVGGDANDLRFERPDGSLIVAAPIPFTPSIPLPKATPPRPPPMLPPNYHWAIGAALPRVA